MLAKNVRSIGLCAVGLLVCWANFGASAHAQEGAPVVVALPQQGLPLPPRLTLPGRDCLSCTGPAVTAPCFDTHRGFLYYGTYALDDDPFNEFGDCPGGQCGYPGAALSLWWIKQRQAHAGFWHHSASPPRATQGYNAGVPHYASEPVHGSQHVRGGAH